MPSPPPCFQRLIPTGAAWLIVAMIGCRSDTDATLGPEATPATARTATMPLVFIQISAGQDPHSCGVTSDSKAYCWGANSFGQLGIGTSDEVVHSQPVLVSGGLSFRQVKAGGSFTCGLTTTDRAYCWGFNGEGQLGDGTKTNRFVPVPVAGGRSFRQISAGRDHTCAVTTSNAPYCWGFNQEGQIGDGTKTTRLTPVRVESGGRLFREVVAGGAHTCALGTDALGYCWGFNLQGTLGDGTTTERTTPVVIRGGRRLRQISAGLDHTCAVTTSNAAYCWGGTRYGQIGDGTALFAGHRLRPVAVLGGLSFTGISAGVYHTCGITTTKLAYCWGRNFEGGLGDGTTTRRTTPVGVHGGHHWSRVFSGGFHTCGVITDERAFCWGDNGSGQLGDGTSGVDRLIPVAVVGPT